MFRINTILHPKDEPTSSAFHTIAPAMASLNEKKKKSSKSNPTTPATPATKEPSNANIARDQTPSEDEIAVPETVPEASSAENNPSSHIKAAPNQIGPQTGMTPTPARASDAQPQKPTQATTATPAHWNTPHSNEAGANDDEEESEFFDDEESSDSDQDEKWLWDDQKPAAPSGEEAGDSVPGHLETPISMGQDEEVSLVEDMGAYVIDGPADIDGVLIEDYSVVDEVSDGVGDQGGGDGNEEVNRSSATATSARRNESPLGVASRRDTSASTPDGNGRQGGGGAGEQVVEVSGAQMDANLRDTTGEEEVQDPAITGLEKSAGR